MYVYEYASNIMHALKCRNTHMHMHMYTSSWTQTQTHISTHNTHTNLFSVSEAKQCLSFLPIKRCISSINITSSISTPVRYYLKTNNIDIVVIFISSAPLNSTACRFATPSITAYYRVTMIISSIVFKL